VSYFSDFWPLKSMLVSLTRHDSSCHKPTFTDLLPMWKSNLRTSLSWDWCYHSNLMHISLWHHNWLNCFHLRKWGDNSDHSAVCFCLYQLLSMSPNRQWIRCHRCPLWMMTIKMCCNSKKAHRILLIQHVRMQIVLTGFTQKQSKNLICTAI